MPGPSRDVGFEQWLTLWTVIQEAHTKSWAGPKSTPFATAPAEGKMSKRANHTAEGTLWAAELEASFVKDKI